MGESAEGSLRRTPAQRRSRQRVEALVAAAEEDFARIGFDTASTKSIASRAGCSVGSLYQFFPNKRALLDAVLGPHGGELDRIAAAAAESAHRGPGAVHRALTEGVIDYATHTPAVRALFCPTFPTPTHAEVAAELQQAMARHVGEAFTRAGVAPARSAPAATAYVEILAALLARAVDAEGTRHPPYIHELREALGAYVAALAPQK